MTTEANKTQDKPMDGSTFPVGRGGSMHGPIPGDDAWIDALLHEDAARQPHIADDGFVVRVLMNMPAPRKPAPRWIVPMAAMVGSAVAVGLTPAGVWFANTLVQLLDIRNFSIAHLSVLVPLALFYVCSFTAIRER
ncbi:hypothetical protein [uncultured Nevskia sp.]|uniref:hypothetical protein n=1 Tax=uncultured Nevskia sp. TaxID=228950 RepID=UPI0025DC3E52|nr:hypothetical protein [uncultured Nevskia sp.]